MPAGRKAAEAGGRVDPLIIQIQPLPLPRLRSKGDGCAAPLGRDCIQVVATLQPQLLPGCPGPTLLLLLLLLLLPSSCPCRRKLPRRGRGAGIYAHGAPVPACPRHAAVGVPREQRGGLLGAAVLAGCCRSRRTDITGGSASLEFLPCSGHTLCC
jgi:hypothetical protein